MAYINKFGGCKSLEGNKITRAIWFWAIHRNIWLSCSHLPGIINTKADNLSRKFNADTEWEMCPTVFDNIVQKLDFVPNIDLSASGLNYQIKPFVSYLGDPESVATDAFLCPAGVNGILCISNLLRLFLLFYKKLITDKACGIIIVPNWPTQSWYPTLKRVLLKPAVFISRKTTLLISPDKSTIPHPLHKQLDLLGCLILGQH